VSFLAHQVNINIVGSRIETKSIFNIDGVITNFQIFYFGIDNLDHCAKSFFFINSCLLAKLQILQNLRNVVLNCLKTLTSKG